VTSERVAWVVAFALVAHGAAVGLGREAPLPDCEAPYLIETTGAWSEVGCAQGTPSEPAVAGAVGLLFGIPLDLNRASAEDLVVLPGIGPARAQAIVVAREEAPFCRVAGLERVHGIGPRSVAGLAGWVRADCVDGENPR
jgi:competence ComEA-like helix-hairpin-helix protein